MNFAEKVNGARIAVGQDVKSGRQRQQKKRGAKLFLGLLFVLLLLFVNGFNPTAVPDAQAVPLTAFLDWGLLANAPAGYPYIETYTNVNGSGVDVTVTIPEIGQDENYRAEDPDTSANDFPFDYLGDSSVFRYWHSTSHANPVTIVLDFSQPVVIDEIMMGGNRLNSGINGVIEFVAKDAPGGLGNTVLPNPSVYPSPGVTDSAPVVGSLTAPLNIVNDGVDYHVEYVAARESYVSIGADGTYRWVIMDYEGAVVQSLVWEEYCTGVTDPQTARDNLAAYCPGNSAYLASFNFAPATDWGDLPDTGAGTTAGNYNTTSGDSGPSHSLDMVTYMGSCVEAELDGQPNATATGDDGTTNFAVGTCAVAGDDEDGVSFSGNWSDGTAEMSVVSSAAACLNVWLDFTDGVTVGSDGDFNDTLTNSEHVIQNQLVAAGTNNPTFALPAGVADGATFFLRARLTPRDVGGGGGCGLAEAYGGTASPNGAATGGEVEDYQMNFSPTAVTLRDVGTSDVSNSLWLIAAAALFAFSMLLALPRLRKARVVAD